MNSNVLTLLSTSFNNSSQNDELLCSVSFKPTINLQSNLNAITKVNECENFENLLNEKLNPDVISELNKQLLNEPLNPSSLLETNIKNNYITQNLVSSENLNFISLFKNKAENIAKEFSQLSENPTLALITSDQDKNLSFFTKNNIENSQILKSLFQDLKIDSNLQNSSTIKLIKTILTDAQNFKTEDINNSKAFLNFIFDNQDNQNIEELFKTKLSLKQLCHIFNINPTILNNINIAQNLTDIKISINEFLKAININPTTLTNKLKTIKNILTAQNSLNIPVTAQQQEYNNTNLTFLSTEKEKAIPNHKFNNIGNNTNLHPLASTELSKNNKFNLKINEITNTDPYELAHTSQDKIDIFKINLDTITPNKYLTIDKKHTTQTDNFISTSNLNSQHINNDAYTPHPTISYLNKVFNDNLDTLHNFKQSLNEENTTNIKTTNNKIQTNETTISSITSLHLQNNTLLNNNTKENKSTLSNDNTENTYILNPIAKNNDNSQSSNILNHIDIKTIDNTDTHTIINKITHHIKLFKNAKSSQSIYLDLSKLNENKKLEVALKINNNNVEIRFITNNDEIYKMIGNDASLLKDALAANNLNLKNMEIIVKNTNNNHTNFNNPNFEHSQNNYNHYAETKDILNILKDSSKLQNSYVFNKNFVSPHKNFITHHKGQIQILV